MITIQKINYFICNIQFTGIVVRKKMAVIYKGLSKYKVRYRCFSKNYGSYFPYTYYKNNMYFCTFEGEESERLYYQTHDWYDLVDEEYPEYLTSFDIDLSGTEGKNQLCGYEQFGTDNNLFFMDNKIYYGVMEGVMAQIYCYDLINKTNFKVLEFECTVKSNEKQVLEMDDTFIYFKNYMIPLSGGKIIKKNVGISLFSHNERFVFYIDNKKKLHKINKKDTSKDIIISGHKFTSVYCTEDRLYLKDVDHLVYDEEDPLEAAKVYIYTMDFEGKNLKKIERGQ